LPGKGVDMSEAGNEDLPATVGELRRRLAELGDPWSVDPRLGDDEPLPRYSRGGQPEEEIPSEARLRALAPEADFRELLMSQPPANPFLQERWVEEGLMTREQAPGLQGPAGSDEGEDGGS
jgi:hypothetical protein